MLMQGALGHLIPTYMWWLSHIHISAARTQPSLISIAQTQPPLWKHTLPRDNSPRCMSHRYMENTDMCGPTPRTPLRGEQQFLPTQQICLPAKLLQQAGQRWWSCATRVREPCACAQLPNSPLDANPDRRCGTSLLLCLVQSNCSDNTNTLRR